MVTGDERDLPWLGDPDRRADDDVEFCVEGEDADWPEPERDRDEFRGDV